MKEIVLLYFCLFSFANLNAQEICDFKEQYLEFMTIEIKTFGNNSFSIINIKEPSKSFCFYPIFKNTRYINYLSKSLLNLKEAEEDFIQYKDQEELEKRFIYFLEKNTIFEMALNELINKTVLKQPKDTISINQLMDNAVKFFTVELNEDGNYKGKVCVGNEHIIEELHKKRLPQVEAFCFSSIFKHLISEEKKFDFINEWEKAVTDISTVSLGLDENEVNLRAQGALYLLMKNNDTLKTMLLEEYENNKNHLPFHLSYN